MLYCKEVKICIWGIDKHSFVEQSLDNICDFREDGGTSTTFGIYQLSREQLLLLVSSLISTKANFQVSVNEVEEVDIENEAN